MTKVQFVFIVVLFHWGCQVEKGNQVSLDLDKIPYPQLSDYNFFDDGRMSDLQPNDGVVPYEVITPLFTDYASKARFVYSSKGPAKLNEDGTISFQEGSVLIKNFYYPANNNSASSDQKDMIETRLLVKSDDTWNAYSYLWNENDTEANLINVGAYQDVSWIDGKGVQQEIEYTVPNKNQCKSCHNVDSKLLPIGPKYKNLNSEFEYASGTQNQVEHWIENGMLTSNANVNTFTIADWQDEGRSLEDRSLAYLEMNCGHCHDEQGQASTTGLYLNTDHENLIQLGICKTPVAAGKGSGGRSVGIRPGDADASILYYRMASDDPGVMMPELGRTIAHSEGLELIRAWIEEMEYSCDM